MNPDVRGNEDMASAPTIPHVAVTGIVRKRPPRSVHLRFPVIYSTEPADISNRAL